MKKRILPIGLFSILLFVFSAFLLVPINNDEGNPEDTIGQQAINTAMDYLAKIRNNQHTGVLNPADVLAARQQMEALANYKSGNSTGDENWIEMGPDNIAGRTRAVIFDNRDASANTLYVGGVSGGIFKTTNLGSKWTPVGTSGQNLNVSCMVQDANGTIYVGTGEGMNVQIYSGFGQPGFGYNGGFVGQGIYKSDANDNFQLIPGTKPVITGNDVEWAYINKLALDPTGNRLFAATHTGLKYASLSDLSNWQSECKYRIDSTIVSRYISSDSIITCDSFKIENGVYTIYGQSSVLYQRINEDTTGVNTIYSAYVPFTSPVNCQDVQVSTNGWLIASINGYIYVSDNGDPKMLVNRSVFPNNQESQRKDLIDFSTHIVIKSKSGSVLHDIVKEYTKEYPWHINYILFDPNTSDLDEYPSSANTGRVSIAIAPTNQNIVYLMAAKSTNPFVNSLFNIYVSVNKGQSWRIIAPGGTNQLNILGAFWTNNSGVQTAYYMGDYANTLVVSPNDPNKILAGGANMWEGKKINETGYFQWSEKSAGDANTLFNGIFNPYYVHTNHHQYAYRPGYNNQLVIATDGGIYFALFENSVYNFQARNKNLNITQFYSLDVTGEVAEVLGGTQNNGTQYVSGKGNTPKKGSDMWRPSSMDSKYPEGTDGGAVAVSSMRSVKPGIEEKVPASFYSKGPWPKAEALNQRIRRSESFGNDYSTNLFSDASPVNTNFYTPMALWESYNNTLSRDSVTFYANEDFEAGETVMIRSNNFEHPFNYELPVALSKGDSIRVQDIISTKFFIATKDNIWMTLEAVRFNTAPKWFKISAKNNNGFTDNPSCIAYSSDANYVFVGNYEGKIYRISNIALAYNKMLADVGQSTCIIATNELKVYEGNTQVVTSIAVDPRNPNKVLVTLGNYGNNNYVYYSTNALSDNPTFMPVQGNLPAMPVYSSVLEMQPETDIAYIGTEEGIWMSEKVSDGEWAPAYNGMGKVPVLALKQQTRSKQSYTITTIDPGTGQAFYEEYTKINNYGMIYAASHGRGIFRLEKHFTVGVDEITSGQTLWQTNLTVFPNPASSNISVGFDLNSKTDVQLRIFDLTGKLMVSENFGSLSTGHQQLEVEVNSLSKGTYLLQIIAGEQTGSAKLVIVK
jgi:hypothetical protein